ncbi:MAG: hypothetical protein A3G39_09895 [Deltaproteobacteria bacterium RIFCSPLOWO2_12_FULL_43_16]|nr:MAG: hypothetical protein A3D30_02045 [Deltaproteobacteria bacterium RIFCSPHIGHO2_02_FULL_43_33]OGQ59502.1 MAG: hypothetical protein A3G39_09895 [Deltaproteobacteria bacterium RIFCSPLOWO2_12_FULL_43_16]
MSLNSGEVHDAYNFAYAIAKDFSDNVYITGQSNGEMLTIKYSAEGKELWAKKYLNPNKNSWAVDISVDSSNNVYVTGWFNGDYATVKYDANGNELWARRYNGGGIDWVNTIAVDLFGNVYVTGNSDSNLGGFDTITIKYDTDGNELWVKKYEGRYMLPINDYYFYDKHLAIDSAGNIYILAGNYYSVDIVKYDKEGNVLWIAGYGANAKDISIDLLDNIYVTGGDGITIAYDTNGNKLWQKESCMSIIASAVDPAFNVYVAGGLGDLSAVAEAGNSNITTIKYGHAKYAIPSPPANLLAIAVSPYQVNLSWVDTSDNEDGFKVERSIISGGPYSTIAILPENSSSYQDAGLIPGTTYFYRVKAFNTTGDSDYANTLNGHCGEAEASTNVYDACSLIDVINSVEVSNRGVKTGLLSLAENACNLTRDGKVIPAKGMLTGLLKEVLAQKGKTIDSLSDDILKNYINNVIDGL